jgi:hypothetical protein
LIFSSLSVQKLPNGAAAAGATPLAKGNRKGQRSSEARELVRLHLGNKLDFPNEMSLMSCTCTFSNLSKGTTRTDRFYRYHTGSYL